MRECPVCKRCYPDNVVICPYDNEPTTHSISGEPILDGRYQLEKRLGQGGMGVVYRATHKYLRTAHAIKVILPDLVGNDPQLVARFRQEALAAAAIRHQNIVNVTDYGVANGTMPFLVMEFVEGESLHDLLAREKRLSPEKALDILSGICAGVGAAHKQGIVHRDLKPLNVMFNGTENTGESVKVLDFGLAKIKSGELLGSFIAAQTTGLMGSPYYMSPEQWADEEPDAQADIYSLGVILHQMLTGDVPFKGSSIPAIMKKHLNDPPTTFAEAGVNLSPEIENVVRKALEKNREKRTQTVEELVSELRIAVLGNSISPDIHLSQAGYITASQFENVTVPKPLSTVRILTTPTEADVFFNGSQVGKSESNGWFVLEGLQRGSYRLRVSKAGFLPWENEVNFNDEAHQIIVQLKSQYATNVTNISELGLGITTGEQKTTGSTTGDVGKSTMLMPSKVDTENTATQNLSTNRHSHTENTTSTTFTPVAPSVESVKANNSFFLILGGIASVFLLGIIGVVGYFAVLPMFAAKTPIIVNNRNANTSPANNEPETPLIVKAEQVLITGGKFKLGRNDGADYEKPAHDVDVASFYLDKTEVTNAEYAQFVTETKYVPPQHFVNGAPIPGQENFPVTNVSQSDANSFAEWRSGRDGLTYRLPTEEEWEYAARNGAENLRYPWGDKWESGKAVLNQPSLAAVGSLSGENKWGVKDLIGNVWEWTSTPLALYPNNPREKDLDKSAIEGKFIIRGGSFREKEEGKDAVTSTSRTGLAPDKKSPALGFRLARDGDK